MPEIGYTVTDGPIAWCVGQFVTCLFPAKMAEWIKVLFGLETLGGEGNIVLSMGLVSGRKCYPLYPI